MAVAIWHGCKSEEETLLGSIYGVVTDKATGEPISAAGVELSPSGYHTVTGTEGQFEFRELTPGSYTLLVTKTGYLDYLSRAIEVAPSQAAKGDVQIEQLPPALKVVDDNRQEISELDYGSAEADVARSFNIFNDGTETLEWQITKTADWITEISKEEGVLKPGATQSLVMIIDRGLMPSGENTTTVHITSSSGSKQLTVIVTNNRKSISLNILETTEITATTALFNAEILNEGVPKYTERGFVYNTSTMPTIDKTIALLTAPVNDDNKFSVKAEGLKLNQTYYVRAYASNSVSTVYSNNQVSFVANASLPIVSTQDVTQVDIAKGSATFNGTVVSNGDPVYTERGFVYGTVPNPTVDNNKTVVSGNGLGKYSANVTGLEEGNVYYVRSYATNEYGTAYGIDASFNFIAAMPTINTLPATNIKIGNGTVTFNGQVETLGDLGYSERGFVYNTTHNPTIDDTKVIASGTGTGKYSINATNIQEGSVYYVRAYLKNTKGVVYGEEVSFDFNAIMPIIKTDEITNKNIANGIATFNGFIETKGDPAYTERGFVYGIMRNPTITEGTKLIVPGTEIGAYMANATSLEEGKTYYVKAYAITPKKVVYGEEISFDFIANMPKVSTISVTNIKIGNGTATFNGQVEALGDLGYTERGFVYNTTHNPTIDDTKLIASGTGTGEYSINATNIQEGSVYYVRAYLKNTKGVVYGEEVSFNFIAAMPTIKTLSATNIKIGNGTATFNGQVEALGDLGYTERGFVYNTTHNPTIDDTKVIASGTGTGKYSINATNIQEGSVYYVRAYLVNSKGVVYGEEVSFNFNAIMPEVQTYAVKDKIIATGRATLKGNITSTGDPSYTERGFVYGTMHNPTVDSDTKVTVSGTGTGEYNANVSGLSMGVIYYVRAYATNEKATSYGEEVILDMTPVMPRIVTGVVEFKSMTTAIFNGSISYTGDPAYTERGFVYGTMLVPSLDNSATKVVVEGTIAGAFNAEVSNLEVGQSYNMRAYATSPAGTVYGETKTVIDPISKEYLALPTFMHDGHVYRVYPDLGSEMTWSQAKEACENMTFGGYNDWILPTKEILNSMYIYRDDIKGFVTSTGGCEYWSSSESGASNAWYIKFYKGGQYTANKSEYYRVRPVRLEE